MISLLNITVHILISLQNIIAHTLKAYRTHSYHQEKVGKCKNANQHKISTLSKQDWLLGQCWFFFLIKINEILYKSKLKFKEPNSLHSIHNHMYLSKDC